MGWTTSEWSFLQEKKLKLSETLRRRRISEIRSMKSRSSLDSPTSFGRKYSLLGNPKFSELAQIVESPSALLRLNTKLNEESFKCSELKQFTSDFGPLDEQKRAHSPLLKRSSSLIHRTETQITAPVVTNPHIAQDTDME
jgi:hypothetical protein